MDLGIKNKIVHDAYSSNSTISSLTGAYSLNTFSDTILLYISNLTANEHLACIPSDSILVVFDSTSSLDTSNIDFLVNGDHCSTLDISFSSTRAGPCRGIIYT